LIAGGFGVKNRGVWPLFLGIDLLDLMEKQLFILHLLQHLDKAGLNCYVQ
jgi:hypothetical protein